MILLKVVVSRELNRVPTRFRSTTYTLCAWSVHYMTKYLLQVLYDLFTDPIFSPMSNHQETDLQLKIWVSQSVLEVQVVINQLDPIEELYDIYSEEEDTLRIVELGDDGLDLVSDIEGPANPYIDL